LLSNAINTAGETDRDRDIYLMPAGGGYDQDFTEWVLYVNGKSLTVRLTMPVEGSKSSKEQPYRIVWYLVRIHPELPEMIKQEVVQILEEALTQLTHQGLAVSAV
jgi:hypothetical protein